MNSTRLRNIIIIIAAVFVIAATAVASVYFVSRSIEERENARIQALAEPLEFERHALERELISITKPLPGGSTITIAAVDLDKEIYTRIWTKFAFASTGEADPAVAISKIGAGERLLFRGTICLSPEEMPDMAGNMTSDELKIMIASGWNTAILVNSERAAQLDDYIADMKSRMSALGIQGADTLYFEEGVYKSGAHDDIIRSHGIYTVINAIDENADPITRDTSDDIWRVGAIGWSGPKSNPTATKALESLLEKHGGAVFAVDTWHEDGRKEYAHFIPGVSEESFERMLFKFLDSVEAGDLYVHGASSAKETYTTYKVEYDLYKNVYEPRQIEINARLDVILAELREIYAGNR